MYVYICNWCASQAAMTLAKLLSLRLAKTNPHAPLSSEYGTHKPDSGLGLSHVSGK